MFYSFTFYLQTYGETCSNSCQIELLAFSWSSHFLSFCNFFLWYVNVQKWWSFAQVFSVFELVPHPLQILLVKTSIFHYWYHNHIFWIVQIFVFMFSLRKLSHHKFLHVINEIHLTLFKNQNNGVHIEKTIVSIHFSVHKEGRLFTEFHWSLSNMQSESLFKLSKWATYE